MLEPKELTPAMKAEAADADKLDQAIVVLRQGDLQTAERLLQEVIAQTPTNYVNEYEQDGTLVVKCWDQEEFLYFVLRYKEGDDKRDVLWRKNAYPRAYYYMGFLEVERGQEEEALKWLDAGLLLEPQQPKFRLEKGKALSSLGDFLGAMDLYDEVLAMGENISPTTRATALRGRGFQLIELSQLDDAETCFLESLELDPTSELARHELGYIAQLRMGRATASFETTKTGGENSLTCASCGITNQEGTVDMVDGKVIFMCKACMNKLTRKPWQFWKH